MDIVIKQKYQLTQLISEDLISYHYYAVNHQTGEPLQVWVYKDEYLNATLIRELIQASDRLVMMDNPYILAMLDYHYDGRYFFTIHEGNHDIKTLEAYIKEETKWNLTLVWKLLTQVMDALLSLETHRLFYGSLNLENVYITDENTIKLTKAILPTLIFKHVFKEFPVVEDCIFFAPEFIQRNEFTIQSDMYAFGVLVYSLLSRKWPYKYTPRVAELKKELLKNPRPFEPLSPSIPGKIEKLISICIQKDPSLRFSSFNELIQLYRDNTIEAYSPYGDTEPKKSIQKELKADIRRSRVQSVSQWVKGLAFSIIFFFACAGGYYLYMTYITAIPNTVVPNVVGLSLEEAEAQVKQNGLISVLAGERHHIGYEKGMVIEAKPPAGRQVKVNRTVRLFISKGVGEVLVPDLLGRQMDIARTIAKNRKLEMEIVDYSFSDTFHEGEILQQVTTPNTFISPSENIKVRVSKGYPFKVKVEKAIPNFFDSKKNKKMVTIRCWLPEDWTPKNIKVEYTLDNRATELVNRYILPGEEFSARHELIIGGKFNLLFNDELIASYLIKNDFESKSIEPELPSSNRVVSGNVQIN
jgi:serine/threonine-protein kinase